ncbi:unnamed protein product [Paramecium octaurelia]|uniref:Uncharacterized protein n=1 Tax=Paramecium octaurelia TaxID=43137 RepID=A0A8S1U9Z8_PAROT|nr:unnamed protein product [Paramecium octaurelia]
MNRRYGQCEEGQKADHKKLHNKRHVLKSESYLINLNILQSRFIRRPYNASYGYLCDGSINCKIVVESEFECKSEDELYLGTEEGRGEDQCKWKNLIQVEQEGEQLKRNYMQVQMGKETFGFSQELRRLFDSRIIVNPEKLL